MADPAPPVIHDVLDHAWDVAQRLAIEVIEYPAIARHLRWPVSDSKRVRSLRVRKMA